MDGITIAILVITAVWFIITFIGVLVHEDVNFSIIAGAILTLILWKYVLALGIIVLVLSAFGTLVTALKLLD